MRVLVWAVVVLAVVGAGFYLHNSGRWEAGSIRDFVTFKDRHFLVTDSTPRSRADLKAVLVQHVSSLKDKPLESREPDGTCKDQCSEAASAPTA